MDRRYIITFKDATTSTRTADSRAKALYAELQAMIRATPSLDMIEAARRVHTCKLHPDDVKPRGPAPRTPNPYFQRYPGELSLKQQRRRRIDPTTALMDPNRGKRP